MSAAELLRLARLLATIEDGDPTWIAANRAVSTAYYALFYALADLCAAEFVGTSRSGPAYRHVYRSLDHGAARRVLDAVRRDGSSGRALKVVGAIFTDLQEKRHAADYDPAYRITQSDLDLLLGEAGRALMELTKVEFEERKLLAARLIGRMRG